MTPNGSISRGMIAGLIGMAASGMSQDAMVRSMSRDIGLPPTITETVQQQAENRKRKKNHKTSGRPTCPECHGVIARDSPCMRRSCKAFNKPRRRW